MLMRFMAGDPDRIYTAGEVRLGTHLPLPTVSKLLRRLTRNGLLLSHRGVKGRYSLARAPEEISVAGVIRALEGPFALTECTTESLGDCQHQPSCGVRGHMERINLAIRAALDSVSVSDLAAPLAGQTGGPSGAAAPGPRPVSGSR